MKSLQPEVIEGCVLVFLADTGPVNLILGYQNPGDALLGYQIQLVDSGQRQLLTVIWGWYQSNALLKGFQKTYTCLGLSPLGEELSPFLDMLPGSSLKSISPVPGVPKYLLLHNFCCRKTSYARMVSIDGHWRELSYDMHSVGSCSIQLGGRRFSVILLHYWSLW